MTIIANGIIDTIKELKQQAKCPFCDKQLEFDSARTSEGSRGDRFVFTCKECKLDFTITKKVHKKEVKWQLDEVRKSYI